MVERDELGLQSDAMTMSNSPLVTVLTPTYNMGPYLAECIESVLKSTYENFEYIIVNNCSTDKSGEIARGYAAKDRRIKVHDNGQFLRVIPNHGCGTVNMHDQVIAVRGDDVIDTWRVRARARVQ